MNRLRRACLRASMIFPALWAAPLVLAQQPGMRYTVVIEAMKFEPAQLTVKPGDTVEWINKDPFPHTATAAGKFDTGEIAAGERKSLRIMGKGTIAYVCALHPTMKASLNVR
jgi:plastocyanin